MEKTNMNMATMYNDLENTIIENNNGLIFQVLVDGKTEQPMSVLKVRNSTYGQVVLLMISLEDTLKYLIKEYPEAYAIALDTDVEVTKCVE